MSGALRAAQYAGERSRGRGRGKDGGLMTTQLSWRSAGRGRASSQPVLGFAGSSQLYRNAKRYFAGVRRGSQGSQFAVRSSQGRRGFFVREGEI